MKKGLNILLILIITFFTLPFGGNTVFADSKDINDIKDGTYDITLKAINKDTGEPSGAAGFINEQALLSVENGEAELKITIPNNDMAEIKGLQIEGLEPQVKEDKDAKHMIYKLTTLNSSLDAQVQYEVPSLGMDHDIGFKFTLEGLDNLPVKDNDEKDESDNKAEEDEEVDGEEEAEDDSHSDETEEPEKDVDNSVIPLDNGSYTIDVSYLKVEEDSESAMASYLDSSVSLEVKDGKVYTTFLINDNEAVTKLQVNGNNAVDQVKEGNQREETFEFNQLDSILDAYVEYQAPYQGSTFKGNADFRVSFDADSLVKVEDPSKPDSNTDKKPDKDSDKTDKKPTPNQNDDVDKTNKNGSEKGSAEKSNQLIPDKAYQIDYTIMHEDGNKPSVSDEFFEKPALLLEKDGKKYLQMKINNGDMIKKLSNKYGNVVLVEENEDGSIVVQLQVNNDLSDMELDLHVVVPAGAIPGFPGYDEAHKAILVFDKDSMEEIEVGDHVLAASNNDNGPTVEEESGKQLGSNKKDNNDQTPKKPKFGMNDSNGEAGSSGEKSSNPKTGDTSGMLLYAFLLLGSVIPLGVKFKRRFI